MASFLDSLTQAFTPEVNTAVTKHTGLDSATITKGLAVVGPLVLGAIVRRASTPSGLDGLNRTLPQDGGAGLGNIADMFTGGAGGLSPALSGVFGSSVSAAGGTLDRKLGFKASSLIPVVLPVALALLARKKNAEKLEPGVLARGLTEEHDALVAKGGDAVTLARSALEAGAKAAELRSRFAPDQWTRIRLAPAAAARLVMLASPSRGIGLVKEAVATAAAIETATSAADPTSLLAQVFDADITKEEVTVLGKDRATTLAVLKDAVTAVSQKSPNDLPAFAQFLHGVAFKVAEETKEGGFLGIGGTRVSKEEQVVLDEIDSLTGAMA